MVPSYPPDVSGAAVSVLHTDKLEAGFQHFTENFQHGKYYLYTCRIYTCGCCETVNVLCLALSLVKHPLAQLCI